jgi:hypothetical protein
MSNGHITLVLVTVTIALSDWETIGRGAFAARKVFIHHPWVAVKMRMTDRDLL